MKIESFILKYYQQQCTPQPLHVPIMPAANQSVMEAIRDEAIAIATKAQAEGNKALLKALAAVPTEFAGLTKEIERIDGEILKVKSDKLKRPACSPDMGKAVGFMKQIGKVHPSDMLTSCGDDQSALLALLEVLKGNGDEHYTQIAEGKLTALLVGYDTSERLTKLESERRGLISFAEQMQESLVQSLGRSYAPWLVNEAAAAKLNAIR